jgi:hypothetical protein
LIVRSVARRIAMLLGENAQIDLLWINDVFYVHRKIPRANDL